MALINCRFYSEVLQLSTSVQVILPQNTKTQIGMEGAEVNGQSPVLYLLHGLSDDESTWIRRTSIERYVSEKNLIVVMPNGERGFYTDMEHGYKYFTFITEELPKLMQQFFHISDKREDTFIAGLSMGGYGALKIALSCPEKYSAAASMSGVVDIVKMYKAAEKNKYGSIMSPNECHDILGSLNEIKESKHDLFQLAKELSVKNCEKPRIYQCCGTEDFLYNDNTEFRDFIKNLNYDYTYEEEHGIHEWAFWDKRIQDVLKWLQIK
ncbi:MAG: alpha/beta hydrolase family protein [Clostridium sp.]|nr:alpha/beta hydrolase family protein [Clostridium sp.]